LFVVARTYLCPTLPYISCGLYPSGLFRAIVTTFCYLGFIPDCLHYREVTHTQPTLCGAGLYGAENLDLLVYLTFIVCDSDTFIPLITDYVLPCHYHIEPLIAVLEFGVYITVDASPAPLFVDGVTILVRAVTVTPARRYRLPCFI